MALEKTWLGPSPLRRNGIKNPGFGILKKHSRTPKPTECIMRKFFFDYTASVGICILVEADKNCSFMELTSTHKFNAAGSA